MTELFTMWKNTRMVVLVALTAAIYAAVLIPFKLLPIIPGFTELRPANALPIVFSLMFGPAAAWGSAIGNLIGDFFGTLGAGSFFGFFGNLIYGLLPYKVWRSLAKREPLSIERTYPREKVFNALTFLLCVFLSSTFCGLVIGWGVEALGLVPFKVLAPIIITNNTIVSIVFSPILLLYFYPRVKKWGLLYIDVMDKRDLKSPKFPRLGICFITIFICCGLIMGLNMEIFGKLCVLIPIIMTIIFLFFI